MSTAISVKIGNIAFVKEMKARMGNRASVAKDKQKKYFRNTIETTLAKMKGADIASDEWAITEFVVDIPFDKVFPETMKWLTSSLGFKVSKSESSGMTRIEIIPDDELRQLIEELQGYEV